VIGVEHRIHATATTSAPPERVYEVIADVTTHLRWAGEDAPRKDFRLLTLDAPHGISKIGTEFRSTGTSDKSGKETFHDRSTVTEARSPKAFAFETASRLDRKHRKAWEARFVHRFELSPQGEGTLIDYTCTVWPVNYVPYWLLPGVKRLTRHMVDGFAGRHLENLARLAEASALVS